MNRNGRSLLIAAALFLLPFPGCRRTQPEDHRRIAISTGLAWVGVSPAEQAGLRMLMADLATTAGAVVFESENPDDPVPQGLQQLTVEGTRLPDGTLKLQGHVRTPGLPDRDLEPTASDACLQMQELLAATGLRSPESAALLPRSPANLLPLAGALGAAVQGTDAEAVEAARAVVGLEIAEPRCAPAAFVQAAGLYRQLQAPGDPDLQSQSACRSAFETAFSLLKGYPRATTLAVRFLTDAGDQRRALALLQEAIARWPRGGGLWPSLAYAARTTGLLDLSLASLQKEDALEGDLPPTALLTRNAYLYAGQWDRFEASLGTGSDERPDPMRDFYRGYIRILRGRPEEALAFFRKADLPSSQSLQFQSLSLVYRSALEGHRPEALLALRSLARSRHGLRVPDGEFTFKLAEAFCFLSSPEEGMDAAQLAFSQGFGCTAWFERAPLTAPLHDLPRWRALITHLQARQQLLEAEFPAKAFGG